MAMLSNSTGTGVKTTALMQDGNHTTALDVPATTCTLHASYMFVTGSHL